MLDQCQHANIDVLPTHLTITQRWPQIGCSVGLIRRFIALKFSQTREVMMQVKRDVKDQVVDLHYV